MPDPAGQSCCILRPQPPSVKPNPTKNPHQTQQSKSLITGYQPSVCDQQQQKFHRCVGNGPFQQRAWWNGARTLHKRHPKCLRLRAIDRQYDTNRRTLKKHIHVLDCSLPGTQLKMILLSIILLFPKLHVSSWNIVPWPKHEMYIYICYIYVIYIYTIYVLCIHIHEWRLRISVFSKELLCFKQTNTHPAPGRIGYSLGDHEVHLRRTGTFSGTGGKRDVMCKARYPNELTFEWWGTRWYKFCGSAPSLCFLILVLPEQLDLME